MKVFKVEDSHGFYLREDGSYGFVKDIDEAGVLYLVNTCLFAEDVEMDPAPSEAQCPNPAERVIYDELKKQFDRLLLDKAKISEDIDKQFEQARNLYCADQPVETPEEWAINAQ